MEQVLDLLSVSFRVDRVEQDHNPRGRERIRKLACTNQRSINLNEVDEPLIVERLESSA